MIVAIPSMENNVDSLVDRRFAHCKFFFICNLPSKRTDFIDNIYNDESGFAGPKVADLLASYGVNEVYAIEVGQKAQEALKMLKIKTNYIDSGQTVKQIISIINI